MVQLVKYGSHFNTNVMHIDGLSTETKPVDKFDGMAIPNGSIYTEIDTGDKYMFDAENKVWYKVSKNYILLDERGYALINGIRLYVSDTEPTGTIPEGSLGIGF